MENQHQRFDITFIRGPRDHSPWKQGSQAIQRLTNSPQAEKEAVQARALFEPADPQGDSKAARFPNAAFELKGW